MTTRNSTTAADSKHRNDESIVASLDDVLADAIIAIERRDRDAVETLLRRHPEHEPAIREFLQNQDWMVGPPDLPPCDLCGTRLGGYQIEAELGRGGMGVVYRARQQTPDRMVALKVIHAGRLADEESRIRFRNEAHAAASIRHPGIVPVHEVGNVDGHDYFSMPLIDGRTLGDLIASSPPSVERAVRLIAEVADAVDAAHRADVIHRDLKPDNVLIDASGHPMVVDFGLASLAGGEGAAVVSGASSRLTRTGQVVGTPHYMCPRQASGMFAADRRGDVYSLGGMLYHAVTGRPPHDGHSIAEVLRSVLQDEPTPPRVLAPHCPHDVAAIIGRSMAFNPDDRYPTAGAMADDLRRHLDGEPVVASERRLVRRLWEELDRDRHGDFFADWSGVLLQIGVIILVAHVAIFELNRRFDDRWTYWIPRLFMLTAIGVRLAIARNGRWLPRGVVERPVFSIWIGYLSSLAAINLMNLAGMIADPQLFPLTAILSSFGFMAMAGHVWGGSMIAGVAFLATAAGSAALPVAAPLLFGGTWMASLGMLSRHYADRRRSGRFNRRSIDD